MQPLTTVAHCVHTAFRQSVFKLERRPHTVGKWSVGEESEPVPLHVVQILHFVFGAMFVLRWFASQRARRPVMSSDSPLRLDTAPHASTTLALQVTAMGLLYLALGLTLMRVGPDPLMISTPLFPPQRASGAAVMLVAECLLAWTMLVFGS